VEAEKTVVAVAVVEVEKTVVEVERTAVVVA